MAEKETVFASKVGYTGVLSFKELYLFCYRWITEETGLDLMETKYSEKIVSKGKNLEIFWDGTKDLTDYFRFKARIEFWTYNMEDTEINDGGVKIKANKGKVEIKVKAELIRDYKGKFERDAFRKFLRSIYEKWVIPSRVDQFKSDIAADCDEFLNQAKAFLDLEGKR